MIQVLLLHSFIYVSYLVKQHTIYYCFCMKRIALCICMCSFSPSRFLASLIRNIGEFWAKKYFIDHWTANAIQLLVPTKKKFFESLLFQNKSQRRGFPRGLLDKYSHLFIWIWSKWTLSSKQKPVCIVKILISEQIQWNLCITTTWGTKFLRSL